MAKTGKAINNVIRGDNRTINITFLQSDGTTPISLSGGTVYFTVNASGDPTDDTSKSIQKVVSGGTPSGASDTFTSTTLGQQQIILTHNDTNIAAGSYWYDAQLVDSVGSYLSAYRGKFTVESDITRT